MTTQAKATKRQLWYLHVLTGEDTRQLNCTKAEVDSMIKQAIAEKTGIVEVNTTGLLCPQCDEVRNHGAKFCYLCGSELISEQAESDNHEARVVLKDYLANEPVANYKAKGMSLLSLCNRFGQIPEALMVQQAAKLVGHRIGKATLNKNYHVARENCLDQVREHFGGRFGTEDDLICEIESIAKLKRSVKQ